MKRKVFLNNSTTGSTCFAYMLRRISSVILILFLCCLNGCSQDDHHDFHKKGKITIDAKRWYVLNNSSKGLEQLFNEKQYEHPNIGYGLMLDNFDAYYPILEGEEISIDSIMMFDWEGTNKEHPTTIFAVTDDWKRIPIAAFTGERYNAWNGPDPKNPDVFTLVKPVASIRYIIINTWGDLPGEIEFYGKCKQPKVVSPVTKKYSPLKYFFGVNAFEWDFEEPNNPSQPDPTRLTGMSNFKGFRHYLDWDKIELKEGVYTFAPASSGGWNYDTIYQWCQANNITVLTCLKALPAWMQETYPAGERDNENIPMRYGKDPANPTSYIEQARAGFQFAARYGKNKNIDRGLIKLDADNYVRLGLGTVSYIECDNERDKWWKGRKGYQTGREYAANLSAFYDGNKHTMGPGAGVKNADTAMKVVMAGLATPNPDYVRGMIDWCKEFRGYKADGTLNLPWDVINYHFYCNDADHTDKEATAGVAPELTKAGKVADAFIQIAEQYGMPVWVTEAGYDIHPQSPQRAIAIKDKTAMETQADWLLRTSLLYSRAGIDKVFYYELVDDNPKISIQYATSGLINADRSRRPVADYFYQTNKLFGEYVFTKTLNNDPIVDKYLSDGKYMYMLVIPDQKGRTVNYTLDLGNADTAFIYKPKAGSDDMELKRVKTNNGKTEIVVNETPIFVTSHECQINTSMKK